MSGSRAKALRKANGTDLAKRGRKIPTPLLDRAYIQAPVGYEKDGVTPRYRSGKQVRAFLAKRGVDVDALKGELEQFLAAREAVG